MAIIPGVEIDEAEYELLVDGAFAAAGWTDPPFLGVVGLGDPSSGLTVCDLGMPGVKGTGAGLGARPRWNPRPLRLDSVTWPGCRELRDAPGGNARSRPR